jgi:hypothetical protein
MITTTIVLLAGALPLRMAAMSLSMLKIFPGKDLTTKTITLVQFRSKLPCPCFPRAVPLEFRGKEEK